MTNAINLTPHAITLTGNIDPGDGSELCRIVETINPSGRIARVEEQIKAIDTITIGSLEATTAVISFGEVVNLPEPSPGTIFIVSRVVAQAVRGRRDVFFPDDFERDEKGAIVAARRLAQFQDESLSGKGDAPMECAHLWNYENPQYLCLKCGEEDWSGEQPS